MQKPISILISINSMRLGGAQRQLLRLLSVVDHSIFKITLVTLLPHDPSERTLLDQLPPQVHLHECNFKHLFDWRSFLQLRRYIKEVGPDLIMSSLFFSNFVIRLQRLFYWVPVVTREHNTHLKKSRKELWVDRLLSPLSTKVVSVSDEVAALSQQQQWLPSSKSVVIYNGFDFSDIDTIPNPQASTSLRTELGIPEGALLGVYVGRVVAQKRVLELIDLFAGRSKDDVHLLIVGDGAEYAEANECIKKQELQGLVTFVGRQRNPFPYYGAADFFISCSAVEGMSNTHLEALAHNLPIISTPTGGTSALLQSGVNGYLLEGDLQKSFDQALKWLVSYDRKSLTEANQILRPVFSIEKNKDHYQRLWKDSVLR